MSFIDLAKNYKIKPATPETVEKESFQSLLSKSESIAFTREGFPVLLDVMAQTGYTVRNSMLVLAQTKSFSALKSFNDWKKAGRSIKKGETAIRICVPATDGENMFRVEKVFDVSQTDGKEPFVEAPKHARLSSPGTITRVTKYLMFRIDAESVEVIENCPKPIAFDLKKGVLLISDTITDEQAFSWLVRAGAVNGYRNDPFVREVIKSGEDIDPRMANYIDFVADASAYVAAKSAGLSVADFDVSRIETIKEIFGEDTKLRDGGMREGMDVVYASSTCLLDELEQKIPSRSQSIEPERKR